MWFRNIERAPALAIQIACQQFDPIRRILTRTEALAFLEEWLRRHPIEARIFRKQFEFPSKPSREALCDSVGSHPVIPFRPKSQTNQKVSRVDEQETPFSEDTEEWTRA